MWEPFVKVLIALIFSVKYKGRSSSENEDGGRTAEGSTKRRYEIIYKRSRVNGTREISYDLQTV